MLPAIRLWPKYPASSTLLLMRPSNPISPGFQRDLHLEKLLILSNYSCSSFHLKFPATRFVSFRSHFEWCILYQLSWKPAKTHDFYFLWLCLCLSRWRLDIYLLSCTLLFVFLTSHNLSHLVLSWKEELWITVIFPDPKAIVIVLGQSQF